VRENRTHGSIGGRWPDDAHGETEHAPDGKPDGLSPPDLPATEQPAAYLTARPSASAGQPLKPVDRGLDLDESTRLE
jgi:hypothetical protein